jgi:hypothetical protein
MESTSLANLRLSDRAAREPNRSTCSYRVTGAAVKLQSKASLAGDPSLRPVVIAIYEARAAGFAFLLSATISVFAAGPEECGFCPVISKPSLTT